MLRVRVLHRLTRVPRDGGRPAVEPTASFTLARRPHTAVKGSSSLLRHAPRAGPRAKLSVLTALHSEPDLKDLAAKAGEVRAGHWAQGNDALAHAHGSIHTGRPSAPTAAFLQPSMFESRLRQHSQRLSSVGHQSTTATHRDTQHPVSSSSSSSGRARAAPTVSSMDERAAQQTALREAYDHADRHHRLRMRKDKAVLKAEVQAFRAAHGGQWPSERDVSRYTDVSLAPVTALHAFAHLDPRTSSMHREVQDSLLIQQSITRSELLKSNERTLVRCLRCFHVYGARPRELWGAEDGGAYGGSSQQSWLAQERERRARAHAMSLMKETGQRRRRESVGRRRQRVADRPVGCPMCGSPRAQWAAEYIHYRTHAK